MFKLVFDSFWLGKVVPAALVEKSGVLRLRNQGHMVFVQMKPGIKA